MTGRVLPSLSAVLAVTLMLPGLAAGQRAQRSEGWTPPRTPDGQPDLQGVWLSNSATPLERPKVLEGRERLTDEEVAELQRRADRLFKGGESDFAAGDGVFQAAWTNPVRYKNPNATHSSQDMVDMVFDNRTSLIIDPVDGRIPPLTPEARARQDTTAAAGRFPAGPEQINNALRCISWSVPRLGGRYGTGDLAYYQILQSPGYVVLYMETGHEARVIPIDGRPPLSSRIRLWNGDSRGRWEGNTLVVETTNFAPTSNFMGAAQNLHVEERFSRVAPDVIHYEVTLNDPTTWTRPWKAMMPLRQRSDRLYEFACHEGNLHIMSGMLAGARVQEQAELEGARPSR
jgi:hypothetical protein